MKTVAPAVKAVRKTARSRLLGSDRVARLWCCRSPAQRAKRANEECILTGHDPPTARLADHRQTEEATVPQALCSFMSPRLPRLHPNCRCLRHLHGVPFPAWSLTNRTSVLYCPRVRLISPNLAYPRVAERIFGTHSQRRLPAGTEVGARPRNSRAVRRLSSCRGLHLFLFVSRNQYPTVLTPLSWPCASGCAVFNISCRRGIEPHLNRAHVLGSAKPAFMQGGTCPERARRVQPSLRSPCHETRAVRPDGQPIHAGTLTIE